MVFPGLMDGFTSVDYGLERILEDKTVYDQNLNTKYSEFAVNASP
jgi:hypothetical protein